MTKLRTAILMFALGVALAALLANDAVTVGIGLKERAAVPAARFAEVKWPFLRDQWGDGRAFRCAAADRLLANTVIENYDVELLK